MSDQLPETDYHPDAEIYAEAQERKQQRLLALFEATTGRPAQTVAEAWAWLHTPQGEAACKKADEEAARLLGPEFERLRLERLQRR